MSNYRLIAFDMDGTLLNSKKEISPRTLEAIHVAAEAGKIVILNTGRCPAELADYLTILPDVRYLNCVSGALVQDVKQDRTIFAEYLAPDIVEQLFDIAQNEDCMIQCLEVASIVQKDRIPIMERYQMMAYKEMFQRVATPKENLREAYEKERFQLAKMNLFHTDSEGRERTYQRILDAGLKVQLAPSEQTSLEVSPKGIHKGIGLMHLCDALHIDISQTIAVGDADNDLHALETAGLAIAMGNANEEIKCLADVIVGDNDHDGCAEAIYQYLLA